VKSEECPSSTGPRTEEGKRQSRRNTLRHGLTAETVIDGLEDSEDYRLFEAAVIADCDAQTAVERELVLRLASLLWRLRRIYAAYRLSSFSPTALVGAESGPVQSALTPCIVQTSGTDPSC
jgi:hypothetical protein